MGKNKLLRYREIKTLENVVDLGHFRPGFEHELKGNWARTFFENESDIILELACGKGDYTIALAEQNPQTNFIGMDIKGERLWKAAKVCSQKQLDNTAFIRTQIDYLTGLFDENEVSEIWITFPDPYLKDSKVNKRLTSPKFLSMYKKVMKPGGKVHLKTDSPELYTFTLEMIEEYNLPMFKNIPDVYALSPVPDVLKIKTYYEKKHLEIGRTIRYLQFGFPPDDKLATD